VPVLKGEVLSDEEIEEAIRLNIDSHPIIRVIPSSFSKCLQDDLKSHIKSYPKQYDHGGMLLMTRKRRRVAEPKKSKKQEDYDDCWFLSFSPSPLLL